MSVACGAGLGGVREGIAAPLLRAGALRLWQGGSENKEALGRDSRWDLACVLSGAPALVSRGRVRTR